MTRGISVILPYIRYQGMIKCQQSIYNSLGLEGIPIEILTFGDDVQERIGVGRAVKKLVEMSKYDLILFAADDMTFEPYAISVAYKAMESFDGGWGLVGFNDNFLAQAGIATHWIGHKKLLPYLDGEFFHTGYRHCFCDNELSDRCNEIGRLMIVHDAVINHFNPVIIRNMREADEHYRRFYRPDNYQRDKRLYRERKASLWKSL